MSDAVEVGVVARPHGVRGELRVALHDDGSTALSTAKSVLLGDTRYPVASARPVKGAVLLCVDGVSDRDAADALRGVTVSVDRGDLDLRDGDVLLADLIGFRVELADGSAWGEVVEISTGPQDRLVIVDGDVERMLPIVDEFVVDIDVEAGVIIVEPPDGLPEAPRR